MFSSGAEKQNKQRKKHTTVSVSFRALMASDLWVLADSGTMSEETVREACCYSNRIL